MAIPGGMTKVIGGFKPVYHKKALDISSQASNKSAVKSYENSSAWLKMLPEKQSFDCCRSHTNHREPSGAENLQR
jgi:hypothetical protein